ARPRARLVPAAVGRRGGGLRGRVLVPGPARAVPRGPGGVRAGLSARGAVRDLDRRGARDAARPARRPRRRRRASNRKRRRRLPMSSDFTDPEVTGPEFTEPGPGDEAVHPGATGHLEATVGPDETV